MKSNLLWDIHSEQHRSGLRVGSRAYVRDGFSEGCFDCPTTGLLSVFYRLARGCILFEFRELR